MELTEKQKFFFEKAEESFTKAIKLNPRFDRAFFMRAETFFKLGKLEEGEKDIYRAIELNPKNEEYKSLLAKIKNEKYLKEDKEFIGQT